MSREDLKIHHVTFFWIIQWRLIKEKKKLLSDLKARINMPVLALSAGALTLDVLFSSQFPESITQLVHDGFTLFITYFGAYWTLLLLATFLVRLVLALSKYGKVSLGNIDKPQLSSYQWASIITASGL